MKNHMDNTDPRLSNLPAKPTADENDYLARQARNHLITSIPQIDTRSIWDNPFINELVDRLDPNCYLMVEGKRCQKLIMSLHAAAMTIANDPRLW